MVKTPITSSSDCTCWLSGERSLPLGFLFLLQPRCEVTMEQYAVLIALVMSLMVGGTYTQWTKSNLLQACENRVDVQFICPDGLRCEDCPRCVTEFLGECMCVPQSFLSEYPDPDPLYSCW